MISTKKVIVLGILSLTLLFLTTGSAAALAGTQGIAAQQTNSTSTATTTEAPTATPTSTATATSTSTASTTSAETAEKCQPDDSDPALTQSRLYAPETQLASGEPGQIAGGFKTDATANCDVRVSITMQVPSGMRIDGASDIMSGGAGIVTGEFTVSPGDVQSIRASVYSENTGTRSVTADIQYWPVGHQDMAKEIDGISMSFNVEEPVTASTEGSDSSLIGAAGPGFGFLPAIAALSLAIMLAHRRLN